MIDDGTSIAELMACFLKPVFNDPKFPKISAEVNRLKNTEGGLNTMCEFSRMLVAEGRVEGRAEGRVEGRAEGQLLTYNKLVNKGVMSVKEASGYMGISEEEFKRKVKELEKEPVTV